MLCNTCRAISFKTLQELNLSWVGEYDDLSKRKYYLHHPHQAAFRASCTSLCHFCVMLWDGLHGDMASGVTFTKDVSPEQIVLEWAYEMNVYWRGKKVMLRTISLPDELKLVSDQLTAISALEADNDKDTGSTESMLLASAWLKLCQQDHKECCPDAGHESLLPTRVIDVGSCGSLQPPLLYESKGKSGQYVTLSYCWGDSPRYMTTIGINGNSGNYKKHQQAIELNTLPRTFRDAIKVTRELGFRWLWIDALCIIQDSEADKQAEMAIMDEIYKNAVLNVAAARGVDAQSGLFTKRDPRWYRPCRLTLKNSQEVTGPSKDHIFVYRYHMRSPKGNPYSSGRQSAAIDPWDSWDRDDINTPNMNTLDKRGWILQEYILSPRTLIFGPVRLEWSCVHQWVSEEKPIELHMSYLATKLSARDYVGSFRNWIHQDREENPSSKLPEASPMHFMPPFSIIKNSKKDRYNDWYAIATNYSKRNISVLQDKLPALSGLAKWAHRSLQTEYLAGLWRDDLEHGLLWYIQTARKGPPSRPPCYLAPSWSWASHINVETVFFHRSPFPESMQKLQMQVTNAQCMRAAKSKNEFGEVVAGHITLAGAMKPARALVSHESRGHLDVIYPGLRIAFSEWRGTVQDVESGKTLGLISFDEEFQGTKPINFHFFVVNVRDNSNYTKKSNLVITGLALVRTSSPYEEYQRIGLASVSADDWLGDGDSKDCKWYRKNIRVV